MKHVNLYFKLLFTSASIILLGISKINAQQNSFTPKIIPQSPNAAALGKYGDVPVTLYTGQINPTIPIYEIKLSDYNFPITLSYSSSGLKTNETPSWVGMGWTLSATGVINRQLRGIPDEVEHGFQGAKQSATTIKSIIDGGYTPTSYYSSLTKDDFLYTIADGYQFDSEPDMFVLSCAGLSGKFFFDETVATQNPKTPVWIPVQRLDLKATIDHNGINLYNAQNKKGVFSDFVVLDTRGVKYTFSVSEGNFGNLDDDYSYGKTLANAWYLSKIETPDNNIIDFSYKARQIDMPPSVSERRYFDLSGLPASEVIPFRGGNPPPTYYQSKITEIVLEKITINNGQDGEILFIESTTDRHDWTFGSSPKSLAEIQIKNHIGTEVKTFKFMYDTSVNRLLLRSIQETKGNLALPPTTFQYNEETAIPPLPSYSNNSYSFLFNEDHWGYYNLNSTGKLIPQHETINDPSGYTHFYFTAENRKPSAYLSSIGQLNKITYSTGGTTYFEWEANSYVVDANKPDRYTACNNILETVAVATATGNNTNLVSQTIPFEIKLPNQCMEFNYQFKFKGNNDIINAEIKVVNNLGVVVLSDFKERKRPSDPFTDTGEVFNLSRKRFLSKGNYNLVATIVSDASFSSDNQAWIEFRQVASTGSNYVNRQAGGVRIKKVSNCPDANNSTNCTVKLYSYNQTDYPSLSSGVIVSNPVYDNIVAVNLESAINEGVCVYNVPHVQLTSYSQLPIATTLGNHIGYRNVTVTERDEANNTTNGTTFYRFVTADQWPDYVEGGSENVFPYPPPASMDWRRGNIEFEKNYDAFGNWKREITNLYTTHPDNYYAKMVGIKFGQTLLIDCVQGLGTPKGYQYVKYPIITGFNYLATTTESFNYNNGVMSQNTTNEYGNIAHLQITKTTLTNTKGQLEETTMIYPHEKAASGNVYQSMVAANIITPIIEKTVKVDDHVQLFQRTNYVTYKKPSSIQVAQQGGDLVTKIAFNNYDNNGNLLSYTEQNGLTTNLTYWDVAGKKNLVKTKTVGDQTIEYDYIPLVGLSTQTDPNGKITTYEYDNFNRLARIKDHADRTLKEFCYNYAGQSVPCNTGTYQGAIASVPKKLLVDESACTDNIIRSGTVTSAEKDLACQQITIQASFTIVAGGEYEGEIKNP